MNKEFKNENLVKDSNQSQNKVLLMNDLVETELELCQISSFELEDIIENPTEKDVLVWNKMRKRSWDGELLSTEIRNLWKSELRKLIRNEIKN